MDDGVAPFATCDCLALWIVLFKGSPIVVVIAGLLGWARFIEAMVLPCVPRYFSSWLLLTNITFSAWSNSQLAAALAAIDGVNDEAV